MDKYPYIKITPITKPKDLNISLINLTSSSERKDIPLAKDWSQRAWTTSTTYPEYLERTLKLPVRDDDIWILGQQKCGTTWLQEIAWLISHNFDFETAENDHVYKRSSNLEYTGVYQKFTKFEKERNGIDSYKESTNREPPRIIKSHLPPNMLPEELWSKKPKIIYVTRNVKDAAISRFHMYKAFKFFSGTKEQFLDALIMDKLVYTPYWTHVLEFWEMRNENNIFFISYERLKEDLKESLKDLCKFIGNPVEEETLITAVNHLNFNSMKSSKAGKSLDNDVKARLGDSDSFSFIRRGITGSYLDEFPEGYSEKIDIWIEKCLNGTGVTMEDMLQFKYC